jgi:hypothetical protein
MHAASRVVNSTRSVVTDRGLPCIKHAQTFLAQLNA